MLVVNKNTDNLRSLSQIFTPSNFRKIVRNGDIQPIRYRIEKHINDFESNDYSSVLQFLYKLLEKDYRNEYVYKNALLNKKLLGTYSLNTTTVLNEFRIGGSIADFLLLNGEAKLFEIKTELDSLEKLEKQIADYQKFANKVYVVVSPDKTEKVYQIYKYTSVGIIEYTENNTLRTIQEAECNTVHFDHEVIFKTLRKKEYLDIIKDYFNIIPDVPNTQIFKESLALVKEMDIILFQDLAVRQLKHRKIKCPDLLRSSRTPKELKHICYTLNLSENEYSNLFSFLNKKI